MIGNVCFCNLYGLSNQISIGIIILLWLMRFCLVPTVKHYHKGACIGTEMVMDMGEF